MDAIPVGNPQYAALFAMSRAAMEALLTCATGYIDLTNDAFTNPLGRGFAGLRDRDHFADKFMAEQRRQVATAW